MYQFWFRVFSKEIFYFNLEASKRGEKKENASRQLLRKCKLNQNGIEKQMKIITFREMAFIELMKIQQVKSTDALSVNFIFSLTEL